MPLDVVSATYHVTNPEMRTPFHFGNVAMRECPHVFLDLSVEIDGSVQQGVSMGGLIPMWFYKDPSMTLAEGLENMIEVFRMAGEFAERAGAAETAFDAWMDVYERQQAWASDTDYPPLLWVYGVSMVEQALVDAVCRHEGIAFGDAVRENVLGISLGAIHDVLGGYEPADLLPEEPRRSTAIRHTVGLTDPLTDDDIDAADRLEDGLPQSLSAYAREDGVDRFKIKLSADQERDADRLSRIHDVLEGLDLRDYAFTVDANEGYASARAFKQQWEALRDDPDRQSLLENLLYVEQPLARDDAFSAETREVFRNWEGKPPIIIDESDDLLERTRTALEHGYDGTSHKNCKGVFKGIANACLIERRNRLDPEREYILSAEDLTTIGPIELLQDLAVVATIGAGHVERNGHHYFRGLSAFSEGVQDRLLDAHGDLYRRHEEGFATLSIEEGEVDLNSVVDAPFGVGPAFDTSQFTPVETWIDDGLAGE